MIVTDFKQNIYWKPLKPDLTKNWDDFSNNRDASIEKDEDCDVSVTVESRLFAMSILTVPQKKKFLSRLKWTTNRNEKKTLKQNELSSNVSLTTTSTWSESISDDDVSIRKKKEGTTPFDDLSIKIQDMPLDKNEEGKEDSCRFNRMSKGKKLFDKKSSPFCCILPSIHVPVDEHDNSEEAFHSENISIDVKSIEKKEESKYSNPNSVIKANISQCQRYCNSKITHSFNVCNTPVSLDFDQKQEDCPNRTLSILNTDESSQSSIISAISMSPAKAKESFDKINSLDYFSKNELLEQEWKDILARARALLERPSLPSPSSKTTKAVQDIEYSTSDLGDFIITNKINYDPYCANRTNGKGSNDAINDNIPNKEKERLTRLIQPNYLEFLEDANFEQVSSGIDNTPLVEDSHCDVQIVRENVESPVCKIEHTYVGEANNGGSNSVFSDSSTKFNTSGWSDVSNKDIFENEDETVNIRF